MHYVFIFLLLLAANFSFAKDIGANKLEPRDNDPPYVRGQILVKINNERSNESIARLASKVGAKKVATFGLVDGLNLYQFDPNLDVMKVIETFLADETVIYAEPDFIYQISTNSLATVNDPDFSKLWGLENRGQTGGKNDADINAETMWGLSQGSRDIVIGVIDTGMDYTHPDLVDNVWKNPGEIPDNNKDDDQNGYVDDMHGINAIKNSGNPMDDNVHGTHVAGTIGATGNNSVGVVGVAQSVRIAACKFLSSGGSGSISDAIKCMDYFAALKTRSTNPVNLVATNNSWGGGGSSQAMLDAVRAHERIGLLFIAAAGNESSNNDVTDSFPANYDVPNVISVAATDHNDRLASFSNFGKKTVHVAAPGVKILSTVLSHKYGELSGTSMATPHVSGLAAVIASHFRGLGYRGIKNLIMTGGQKIDSTLNTTISGRRIRGADSGGLGSLTCSDQTLVVRKEPVASTHKISVGKQLLLSAHHIKCADPAGPLTLYNGTNGRVVLYDNGENGDVAAGDGIYSLAWKPTAAGTYALKFSDTDTVTVTVYDKDSLSSYEANDRVPYQYLTIGGSRLQAGDDTMHHIQSPFPILFGGHEAGFSELYVSSNGTISFTERNQPGFLNQSLPTSVVNTLIAPFWDDLVTVSTNSDIFVETLGTAPNRRFVVEWWRFRHYRSTGLIGFQVVFYENSPDFQFNYIDTNFSSTPYNFGASATVGVQISQDNFLQYSHNEPKIPSEKSIRFTLQ